MEAYIKSYEAPMTEQRIKAVRMLTSLDSGPVLAASTQLAAEQELLGQRRWLPDGGAVESVCHPSCHEDWSHLYQGVWGL